MARTMEETNRRSQEIADRLERGEFEVTASSGVDELRAIADAFRRRTEADNELAARVASARTAGHSWTSVGVMLGTSGEAARRRYGRSPDRGA